MTKHPAAEEPERLFTDPEKDARWRARFRAARISLPEWARDAPDRNVYTSNASGVWETYAWDRLTGNHRQVTDRPNGTYNSTISPDGEHIWWFADTDGDEFGSWVVEPFAGRPVDEEPRPAIAEVPRGYPAGVEIGRSVAAIGISNDDGTTIVVSHNGQPGQVIYSNEHDAGVAAHSRDERYLAIAHSEHGDNRHTALRVVTTTGEKVAERWDGKGKGLDAIGFSPVDGDPRLLVLHERHGREELLIWDVEADTETEISLDLPGEVTAAWYPDGRSLLVVHTHQARNTVHRYEIETDSLSFLDTPAGTIGSASVRPDGTIEYSWSSAAEPPLIRALHADGTDRVLLTPPGDRAPGSVSLTDVFVPSEGGDVHALVARPADAPDGPLPTVFSLHGGPHSADEDRFSAYRAAWIDAGLAVVHVNYRGSTGYGSAWRDAIEGRPGLTELADVAAVHEWAVGTGLADPEKCVVAGASWGGYLSLLAAGVQPDKWAAAVGGVPVADYFAAYEDEMEPLRAFDRALFGGSPEELPDLYRECSPLTYVDQVRAPILVWAGENDPRCPIRQIDNYLDRLAERGAKYEEFRYDAGHGSLVVSETIKQVGIEVHFVLRMLGMR
ncbi:Dipeptidyl aminopeptidase/acylaminoacyl peptidase [Kibdelosporangium sp. 4NS15]|uniref:Dipeptidyl aminopeptidase/acylaminoacyl peptidase n=1 Tax=Kibdelosporangium persicum TaxID=2698649 RepID=A0ABX2F4P1_9PSEU|nr:prolyl oligopeptidase family serine peptidase [Kibdelosporangium persicum]NRN66291.1 Dipeptidyl aminopeptidase/acylaminoacyl peptidase [Kibdelosporangium persicum]